MKLIKLTLIVGLLCFSLTGGSACAQERLILLHDSLLQNEDFYFNYYLELATVKSYVRSNLQEAWVKKTFTPKDSPQDNKKKRRDRDLKAGNEDDQKKYNRDKTRIAYQRIHMQIDPSHAKYTVLEVQSFNRWGQLLTELPKEKRKSRKVRAEDDDISRPVDWTDILPGTLSAAAGRMISDYLEKNPDQVQY
jgi:hypothetical protein